jgi:two-component system CheB/CheR fusion protein
VDREKKLFIRKSTVARLPTFTVRAHPSSPNPSAARVQLPSATNADFQREADRILLNRYAPPGVLINSNLDILQFRGRTRPYLEPPQGEASFSLLKMANEGLFAEIHLAVQDARQQHAAIRRENIRVWEDSRVRNIHFDVLPVTLPTSNETCFLVLFEEAVRSEAPRGAEGPQAEIPPALEDLAQLRKENNSLREYLQLVREQHEASVEELKSSNEELLSSNEELQSTNEELETAKEEYQSANEEMTTLNEEMVTRNQEMVQLNNDMTNLINTLNVPIVIVGVGGRIRRFTPAAEKPMRLASTDVGRKLGDVKLGLEGPDLEHSVQEVIGSMVPAIHEMRDREGRWYSAQVHPYRTADNRIEGAVIILIDINGLKSASERLRESEAYARAIVDTIREPLVILRDDLRVNTANASFYETFRQTPEETEGLPFHKLGGGRWNIPELRAMLESTLAKEHAFEEFEMMHEFPALGMRNLRLNARRLEWKQGAPPMVLLAIEDITIHRRAEAALREQSRELERAVLERTADLESSTSQMESFTYSVSHDLRAPLRAMQGYAEALLEDWGGKLPAEAREYVDKIIQAGARLDRLILDVLTYSRAAAGEVGIGPVDTERVAREVIAQYPELSEGGVRIAVESPLEPVLGHEASLAQCLSNLLLNAVKFMAPGVAPHVRVRTERLHSLVRIWVEDNGIGIDPEYQQKIFGMFEKLHRQEEYPGTGIGLAIVKKAVERMGGLAGVESARGKGSRFWIQLPAADAP